MMKLSNMVKGLDGDHIAQQLIAYWEHDEGTLMFWRASSNFIYAFEHGQKRYFLRFSHSQKNSIEQVTAELEFMEHLRSHQYNCVAPVPSFRNQYIETVARGGDVYFAMVFEAAHGTELDESIDRAQCEDWG